MASASVRDPLGHHLVTPEKRRSCSLTTSPHSRPRSARWITGSSSRRRLDGQDHQDLRAPVVHSTVDVLRLGAGQMRGRPALHGL